MPRILAAHRCCPGGGSSRSVTLPSTASCADTVVLVAVRYYLGVSGTVHEDQFSVQSMKTSFQPSKPFSPTSGVAVQNFRKRLDIDLP